MPWGCLFEEWVKKASSHLKTKKSEIVVYGFDTHKGIQWIFNLTFYYVIIKTGYKYFVWLWIPLVRYNSGDHYLCLCHFKG